MSSCADFQSYMPLYFLIHLTKVSYLIKKIIWAKFWSYNKYITSIPEGVQNTEFHSQQLD